MNEVGVTKLLNLQTKSLSDFRHANRQTMKMKFMKIKYIYFPHLTKESPRATTTQNELETSCPNSLKIINIYEKETRNIFHAATDRQRHILRRRTLFFFCFFKIHEDIVRSSILFAVYVVLVAEEQKKPLDVLRNSSIILVGTL